METGTNSTKPHLPKSHSQWKAFFALLAGAGLFMGLTAAVAWYGPDPSQVIRASSPEVPDFSHLSEAEATEQLRRIAVSQGASLGVKAVEWVDDGVLRIALESEDTDYRSTTTLPLAELDQFLYAEQAPKGKQIWSIRVYCANYQACLAGTHSRTAGDYRLNATSIMYLQPNADVRTVLGLLSRLFELHGASSTIDTRKNTIRISEEYWRQVGE